MKRLTVTLSVIFVLGTASGKIISVDDDPGATFDSIQAAIDHSEDGDTVMVEKGTYQENINFKGKNIIVTSTKLRGAYLTGSTIIDGGGLDSVVTFAGTENASCVLSGFTIKNGYQDSGTVKGGGGICGGSETEHTGATIINNVIKNNFAWDGGGISRCDGLIKDNLITNNTTRWWQGGGGLYECNGVIRNNIIVGNESWGCDGSGGLSSCKGSVISCTIALNTSEGLNEFANGNGLIENCIIWGNTPQEPLPATSFCSTDVDPLFVSAGYWWRDGDPAEEIPGVFVLGDYHLRSQGGSFDDNQYWINDDITSPCIDAGNPLTPIGTETFPNGGVINLGAYGGTVHASRSYFDAEPCEIIIAGDINGDCVVNLIDFAIMTNHWLEVSAP